MTKTEFRERCEDALMAGLEALRDRVEFFLAHGTTGLGALEAEAYRTRRNPGDLIEAGWRPGMVMGEDGYPR